MIWTNRGKYLLLKWAFCAEALPDNFYVMLITNAVVPTEDTNTFSELTEIADGNGYTEGGYELYVDSSSPDFDVLTEDDTNDRAIIQIKDLIWTASGGSIPASGDGARYAVLTNGTGGSAEIIGDREVLAVWDLISSRTATVGQAIKLANCELRAVEPDQKYMNSIH